MNRAWFLLAFLSGAAWTTAAIAQPSAAGKGKLVYQASCAACHSAGVAGAPKPGDSAAWTARLAAGRAAVYANAIKGSGKMPAKGGNASLPDGDVRAAVDFMLGQLRDAPPAPASAAPASAAPAPVAASLSAAGQDPNAFNRLMTPPGLLNPPPVEDGIHDPASPGTAQLQAPRISFQALPRNNLGNHVDWSAALGAKLIQPRWDARDPKAEPLVMDLNIVREVKGSMPDVVFPHKLHTEWLDCANCHPAIFIPQKGANQISMAAIMLGQKCGVCHGRVAFPITECRQCHARQKSATARAGEGVAAGSEKR